MWMFLLTLLLSSVSAQTDLSDSSLVTTIGQEWNLVKLTGTESDYNVIMANAKDKKTDICFVPKAGITPSDTLQKTLYGRNDLPILDDKGKEITLKYESSKCNIDGIKYDGYHISLTNAKAVNIDDYIRLGESSLVLIYQDINTIVFDPDGYNITGVLYINLTGAFDNTVNDIWSRFDETLWKFGGDYLYSNGSLYHFKYSFTSDSNAEKHGYRTFWGTRPNRWMYSYQDICANENASCIYQYGVGSVNVTFFNNGTIDPVIIGITEYDSNDTNITQESNNLGAIAHLNMSSNTTRLYYSFDTDDNVTALDYSQYNNDGAYTSSQTTDNSIYGIGWEAENTASFITITDDDSLDFSTNVNFSICVWGNGSNGAAGYGSIFSKQLYPLGASRPNRGYSFDYVSNAGPIQMRIVGNQPHPYGGGPHCTVQSSYSINSWTHMCAVVIRSASCTTNDILLYINGTLDSGRTVTASAGNTDQDMTHNQVAYIGLNIEGGGKGQFAGALDDLMVVGTALSSSDVSDLYNNLSSRYMTRGEQTFPIDIGTANTINLSIDNCAELVGSSLTLKVNNKEEAPIDNCIAQDYDVTGLSGNQNLTLNYYGGFYTPIIWGNITWTNYTLDNICSITASAYNIIPCSCNYSEQSFSVTNWVVNGTGYSVYNNTNITTADFRIINATASPYCTINMSGLSQVNNTI